MNSNLSNEFQRKQKKENQNQNLRIYQHLKHTVN